MRFTFVFLVSIGCGPIGPHGPSSGSAATDGRQGAVCAWGHNGSQPHTELAACQPSLSCCYPCGIVGCNSVCATADECTSWSTLP